MRALACALLLGVAPGCAEQVPGDEATLRLRLTRPTDVDPLAAAGRVDLYLREAGQPQAVAQSLSWPPASGPAELDFAITPRGQSWSLVLTGVPAGGDAIVALGRSLPFDLAPGADLEVPVFIGVPNRFVAGPVALQTARSGHTAQALADGRVVVVGGASAGDPQAPLALAPSVEILDPLAGIACSGAGDPPCLSGTAPPARVLHASVALADGRVAILGGRGSDGATLADLWVLSGDRPSEARDLGGTVGPRLGATLAVVTAGPDQGRLLVVGGCRDGGHGDCPSAAYVVPLDGSPPRVVDGSMPPRVGASATALPNGDIVIAGGSDGSAPAGTIYYFDALAGTLAPATSLATARERHVAVPLPDGSVLLAGGIGPDGAPVGTAEVFVPGLPPRGGVLPTSDLALPRAGAAAAVLGDGSVLVLGGQGASGEPTDTVERFVSQGAGTARYEGTFQTLSATLGRPTSGAVAVVVADGTIVVVGGLGADGAPLAEVVALCPCLPGEVLFACPPL